MDGAQKFTEALSALRVAAEAGDVDAQFGIAVLHDDDEGVVADVAEAIRWYRRAAEQGHPRAQWRLGHAYRDLEAMMTERGVAVDHSTIYRWVQRFAPEMEKRLRWQWRRPQSVSWRIDETYIKVRGKWAYLYRALDKLGNTIDFYLSATRNTKAAKRFLGKALSGLKAWSVGGCVDAQLFGEQAM